MEPQQSLDWSPAERAASAARDRRLHAPRTRSERVLRSITLIAWPVTVLSGITAWILSPGGAKGFLLVSTIGTLVVMVAGFGWLYTSRQVVLRGNEAIIRSALPPGTWSSVRRQLAGKAAVDEEHLPVLLELAQQRRRQGTGQIAFAVLYVPLYLNIAIMNQGWTGLFALLGFALLASAAAAAVVSSNRLKQFERRWAAPVSDA